MVLRRALRVVPLALGAVVLTAHAGTADACGNAVRGPSLVTHAKAALDAGDFPRAGKIARAAIDTYADDPALAEHAAQILALARIRDDLASAEEIDASVRTLEGVRARRHPSDVIATADLGEALVRRDAAGDPLAAYRLLEPLARRDLIGSVHAYAALGRLATQRGDSRLRDVSIARCVTMGGSPELCTAGVVDTRRARATAFWMPRALVSLFGLLGAFLVAALGVASRRVWRRRLLLAAFDSRQSEVSSTTSPSRCAVSFHA